MIIDAHFLYTDVSSSLAQQLDCSDFNSEISLIHLANNQSSNLVGFHEGEKQLLQAALKNQEEEGLTSYKQYLLLQATSADAVTAAVSSIVDGIFTLKE